MDSSGRLPEDIAAEQAYLAELRAERSSAARATLAGQGLLDAPAVPAAPASTPGIDPQLLASLSPEALAQLPPEVRDVIAAARRAVPAPAAAPPAAAAPAGPASSATSSEPDDAELARREAQVLARVQAELAEAQSPLVAARGRGPLTGLLRAVDSSLGALFGRKSTW
jgi:hypothetical protein